MSYTVVVSRHAQRSIAALPDPPRSQIWGALWSLAQNPRPPGCVKLQDSSYWRIRVRDYRVIYEIDDDTQTVTVLEVGHRREIYR